MLGGWGSTPDHDEGAYSALQPASWIFGEEGHKKQGDHLVTGHKPENLAAEAYSNLSTLLACIVIFNTHNTY